MKTFVVGLLTAAVIAVIVGFGLQQIGLSSSTMYSTDNVRLSANS